MLCGLTMHHELLGLILWVLASLALCGFGLWKLGFNNPQIFVEHLKLPLGAITTRRYQFVVWLFVTVLFGLAGFWLPLLLVAVHHW